MSFSDINVYVGFALHAILGKLTEADAIMRLAGDAVRRAADTIARECPTAPAPIYRGLLLEPAESYRADPDLTFLSWSEDRDVARWFACPSASINDPLALQRPTLRDYVAELAAPRSRVLFHHDWRFALGGLAHFARTRPLMGAEAERQIEWSLRTQREVITEPVVDLRPSPVANLDRATLKALECRLSPPWIVEEEGIRT